MAPPPPETAGRPLARALRRAVDVRPHERAALAASFGYFFFLLTGYYVLRPLREEMGVAGGVDKLPWLFSSTFIVMLALAPVWSALVARVPRRRLLPVVYRFFALNLLVFFVAFQIPEARVVAARAFFVWVSVFNLYAVAVFWSYMADVWSPEQGARLFGFVAAGGGAGALLGPLVTAGLVGAVGPTNLLLISVALLEAATWCQRAVARAAGRAADVPDAAAPPRAEPDGSGGAVGGGVLSGLETVFTSGYLRAAGAYLLLSVVTGTTGYFLLTRGVAAAMTAPVERTRFFATLDFWANLLTLGAQAGATGRLLARWGVTRTLAVLPVVNGAGLAAAALAPAVASYAGLHVFRRAAAYGVASPTQALLFTVASPEDKYKAKAFIDTVVYRGGDVLGSWLFTALLALGLRPGAIAALVSALAVPWLLLAAFLGREHRRLKAAPPLRPAATPRARASPR
jgi:AAA family ATP:ADP antiporter